MRKNYLNTQNSTKKHVREPFILLGGWRTTYEGSRRMRIDLIFRMLRFQTHFSPLYTKERYSSRWGMLDFEMGYRRSDLMHPLCLTFRIDFVRKEISVSKGKVHGLTYMETKKYVSLQRSEMFRFCTTKCSIYD